MLLTDCPTPPANHYHTMVTFDLMEWILYKDRTTPNSNQSME